MSIETEKMELRTTIKSLNFKRDRVACNIAEILEINGEFFHEDLDLKDPRIPVQLVSELLMLNKKIYTKGNMLLKLEYEPERYEAKRKAYDFIKLLSLDESKKFLKSVGCLTTIELVEKLIQEPNLIEEVFLNGL